MRLSENNTQNTERNPKTAPHTPRSYQKEHLFIPKTRPNASTDP
jgi:hypothetical protein